MTKSKENTLSISFLLQEESPYPDKTLEVLKVGDFISLYGYYEDWIEDRRYNTTSKYYMVDHFPCVNKDKNKADGTVIYHGHEGDVGHCETCDVRCPDEVINMIQKIWAVRHILEEGPKF